MPNGRAIWGLLLVLILGALLWPVEAAGRDRFHQALWAFLHFPAMGMATLGLARVLPPTNGRATRRAVAIAFVVVPLIEAVQHFTGRTPSWNDIITGWLGVMAGGVALAGFSRRGMVAVVVLALMAGIPVFTVSIDRRMAARAYPFLATFRTPMEAGRWVATGCAIKRSKEHAAYGEYSLSVAIRVSEQYPGIFMEDVHADWSDASALILEIHLAGTEELSGWVRVDDQEAPAYADRFQSSVVLAPGDNSVHVELGETFRTPNGRPLRSDAIRRWGLFFDQTAVGRQLYLDAAYLRIKPEQ